MNTSPSRSTSLLFAAGALAALLSAPVAAADDTIACEPGQIVIDGQCNVPAPEENLAPPVDDFAAPVDQLPIDGGDSVDLGHGGVDVATGGVDVGGGGVDVGGGHGH